MDSNVKMTCLNWLTCDANASRRRHMINNDESVKLQPIENKSRRVTFSRTRWTKHNTRLKQRWSCNKYRDRQNRKDDVTMTIRTDCLRCISSFGSRYCDAYLSVFTFRLNVLITLTSMFNSTMTKQGEAKRNTKQKHTKHYTSRSTRRRPTYTKADGIWPHARHETPKTHTATNRNNLTVDKCKRCCCPSNTWRTRLISASDCSAFCADGPCCVSAPVVSS